MNSTVLVKKEPSMTTTNEVKVQKVLVVDDEKSISELITTSLRFVGFEVRTAASGAEALRVAEEFKPHALILDVMLPDLDGFEVCKKLRADGQDVGVLFLTAKDTTEDKIKGLTLGGDDYVTKPFDFNELEARVRAVLRRRGGAAQTLQTYADLTFDPLTATLTVAGEARELRNRELRLFEILLAGPDRIFSKTQLVDRLFSAAESVTDNAIEVYVGRLRRKLEGSRARIETVRGVGYRLTQS